VREDHGRQQRTNHDRERQPDPEQAQRHRVLAPEHVHLYA
jgi:hypothetical protein